LLGAFGIVVVLMITVGLFALTRLGSDNAHLGQLATHVVPSTRTVGDVNALMNKYRQDQLHYIVARPSERPGAAGIAGELSQDVSRMHDLLASYDSAGLVSSATDRGLHDSFRVSFAQYVTTTAPFRGLAQQGHLHQASTLIAEGEGNYQYNRLISLITTWLDEKVSSANAGAAVASSGYHAGVALILALLALAVALAVGVALLLARRVTRAVRAIGQAAAAIFKGEIVPIVEVSSRDELGDLALNFDGLVEYLRGTVAVAEAIAGGDLDVEVRPAGEHDALGHALVAMTESLRGVHRDLRASEENLRAVAHLARGLPSHENPRQAICKAAREIAHADTVQLWEADAEQTHLRITAAVGVQLSPDLRIEIDGETSGAAIAYRSCQRRMVFDARAPGAAVSVRMRELLGAASVLYDPVMGADGALGVLVVIWETAITETQDRDIEAVGLLAAEAAVAIERAELTAQLRSLARKDALTGLDNRRVWDEEFPDALQHADRSSDPLCVAIADLDNFKSFNDAHGHQVGDRLLRSAADAWSACLRGTDLLARYGGEEFAFVLYDTDLPTAARVLDRLRLKTPEGQTCSIGLAEWDRSESPAALLARADSLVYQAKAAGRNQVMFAAASGYSELPLQDGVLS
jgi:diguanylate cyclase (GGDEF)-like protein